jgi:GDPmannose 4,6-dehydratase
MKRALVTGINGQDGSYLAEYLLELGYNVHGTLKRNSIAENQSARLNDGTYAKIKENLQFADVTDMASLVRVVMDVKPHEIYNLAAQSHVKVSFDQPLYTIQATGLGVMNLLEATRLCYPSAKIYQASSSEMFGNNIDPDGFQRETTPMSPVSPYGCAKQMAYSLMRCYRESYNMFLSNGILFNHESPRRGANFVTNKVVIGAVRIKKGLMKELRLGNLDATRDWGHAKDYVRAMHAILQLDECDDFVMATGRSNSVRHLCEYVFNYLDLNYNDHVVVDPRFVRPLELHNLKGDASKLLGKIGPTTKTNFQFEYTFESMLDEMIEYWMEKIDE